MVYVLPLDAIKKFSHLRADYQSRKKVNLDAHSSIFGLPTFFGGTDIIARKYQIEFLEKLKIVLQANLNSIEEINSPEKSQANLTASRVMIAACFYIQSQIPIPQSDSILYNLINENLGISPTNYLDEQEKELCYFAANRLITYALVAFDQANAALKKAKLLPIADKQWHDFSRFLFHKIQSTKTKNPYTNYPVTSITMPLFGTTFSYVGVTSGILLGDLVSQSTSAMPANYQLTAAIGGAILVLGGPATGPFGMASFASVVASRLISTFCSVTLGHILGKTMGVVGQGAGAVVGLPFDLAFNLVWRVCSTIGSCYTTPKESKISGLRIVDGMIVVNGVLMEFMSESQLALIPHKKYVEIKDDGHLYIDGEAAKYPDSGAQLPPLVLTDLTQRLNELFPVNACDNPMATAM